MIGFCVGEAFGCFEGESEGVYEGILDGTS
jgi:hypothetical protein